MSYFFTPPNGLLPSPKALRSARIARILLYAPASEDGRYPVTGFYRNEVVAVVRFDETFRLDLATRAHIAPGFDVDALERLLRHLEPPGRPIVLDGFLLPEYRVYAPAPNEWWTLKGFTDSVLNELLAEVWQPFWNTQPTEMLADPDSQYPGQDLALQLRTREIHRLYGRSDP